MSQRFYIAVVGISLMTHLLLAFFASKEITDYPLITFNKKIIYQLLIWLLPIVGTLYIHKKLNIGWGSGVTSNGGNTYTSGGTGISNSGDSGFDGGDGGGE